MILITSASYVTPELQSEFGKIPPSFLPLGGRRLYEYQVQLFKISNKNNTTPKIVLSLPESFQLSESDKKKLNTLDVSILFIPDNLTLGESVVYALNMNLPINDGLSILHGDTYFDHIESTKNSISVSMVDTDYDWDYLAKDSEPTFNIMESKLHNIESLVLSGYFNIEHTYEFIQTIVQSKYSFIEGLKNYSKTHTLNAIKHDTWLDFGLVTNYFHSKKRITTERAFNELSIENGYVNKRSSLAGKLDGEINWFNSIPDELSLYIPRFYSSDDLLSYKTEYLYINTLSELFVFGRLSIHAWRKIFQSLKRFLEQLHNNVTPLKKINFNYKKKTSTRIKDFSDSNEISLTKEWVFNGKTMPSIQFIINDIDKYIPISSTFCYIHGDFCFSNIMYDFKSDEIKTFDPRGVDFNNKITVFGEKNYDFAKLMHSIIGLYDFIISEFYTCKVDSYKINFEIEISNEIQLIQNCFFDVFKFKNKAEIYAVMIHLFISMLPLHDDNPRKQEALLANMFRLYKNLKEGI